MTTRVASCKVGTFVLIPMPNSTNATPTSSSVAAYQRKSISPACRRLVPTGRRCFSDCAPRTKETSERATAHAGCDHARTVNPRHPFRRVLDRTVGLARSLMRNGPPRPGDWLLRSRGAARLQARGALVLRGSRLHSCDCLDRICRPGSFLDVMLAARIRRRMRASRS
jgi:hypothetical protein